MKFLPIGVIVILFISGLIYLRLAGSSPFNKQPADKSQTENVTKSQVTDPLSAEARISALEEAVNILAKREGAVDNSGSGNALLNTTSNSEARIKSLETSVLDLKGKVAQLEKNAAATPSSTSSKKAPLYIPLGSGGSSSDRNWVSIDTYEVSLDPADYPGYTSMQLEIVMKLIEKVGEGRARLYNTTDGAAVSYSDVSTTSDKYVWLTSATFKPSSGKKTYKLQLQTTQGYELPVQSARIKVNF